MSNSGSQAGALARQTGSSGKESIVGLYGTPFYAVQQLLVTARTLEDYGWSPSPGECLVQIFYAPDDAPRGRVAGMISVGSENLSAYFDDPTYRIGVPLDKVRHSIVERIDGAKKLMTQGGGEKLAETEIGRMSLENLEHKVHLLEYALAELDQVTGGGWTHVILATAWCEVHAGGKRIDWLDLNDDFFKKFYPRDAFPIAGLTPNPTWVNRDYFLPDLLPESFQVTRSPSQGQVVTSPKYPSLRITFNLAAEDVVNANTGKKAKLVGPPSWPTVEDIVRNIKRELQANPYGPAADRVRKKAYRQVVRFMVEEQRLRKKKKDRLADKNSKAAKEISDAVGDSFVLEQKKLIQDIDKIKDPMSPVLDQTAKHSLMNLAGVQTNPKGAEEDENQNLVQQTMKVIVEKYKGRAATQTQHLEKIDPLSKKCIRQIRDLMKTSEEIMLKSTEDFSVYGNAISKKYAEGMSALAKQPGWDEQKFRFLYDHNFRIGEAHKPSPQDWATLKQKNDSEMTREFQRQPSLKKNPRLARLVRIHVEVFEQKPPEEMLADNEIAAYYDEVEQKRRAHEKMMELPEVRIEAGEILLVPGPKDPDVVK